MMLLSKYHPRPQRLFDPTTKRGWTGFVKPGLLLSLVTVTFASIYYSTRIQPWDDDSVVPLPSVTDPTRDAQRHELQRTTQQSQTPQPPLELILHIGPHKTATSTIQCELTYYNPLLVQNASFVTIGRHYRDCQPRHAPEITNSPARISVDTRRLITCLERHTTDTTNPKPCHKESIFRNFDKVLQYLSSPGLKQNIILSDEAFSRIRIAESSLGSSVTDGIQLFLSAIRRHGYRIRVVIFYRHYYEWITSMHNEQYKPLDRRAQFQEWTPSSNHTHYDKTSLTEGKPLRTFVDFYDRLTRLHKSVGGYLMASEKQNVHPAQYLADQWTKWLSVAPTSVPEHENAVQTDTGKDTVELFHMHETGTNLVLGFASFVNDTLAQTLRRRKEINPNETIPERSNPSLPLDFDILAVKAREQGLVPNAKHLTRRNVASYVEQAFQTGLVFENATQIPHVCLDDVQLEQLFHKSLSYERSVFPETNSARLQRHRTGFDEAVKRKKFCNMDSDKLLQDTSVQDMFRMLK